jgi:hypothetical protein
MTRESSLRAVLQNCEDTSLSVKYPTAPVDLWYRELSVLFYLLAIILSVIFSGIILWELIGGRAFSGFVPVYLMTAPWSIFSDVFFEADYPPASLSPGFWIFLNCTGVFNIGFIFGIAAGLKKLSKRSDGAI